MWKKNEMMIEKKLQKDEPLVPTARTFSHICEPLIIIMILEKAAYLAQEERKSSKKTIRPRSLTVIG